MLNKNSYKNLINDEQGNSMVEFALILPLLIVLTMGGIYLSVSFGQKSIMNGLTFLEGRAGSVRANYAAIDKLAKETFKRGGNSDLPSNPIGSDSWLDKTTANISVEGNQLGKQKLRVVLEKEAMNIDMLSNSLAILSGNKPSDKPDIRKIRTTAVFPYEYSFRSTNGYISDRPKTYSVVDYEAKNTLEKGVEKIIDKIPSQEAKDTIKEYLFSKLVDPKKIEGINDSEQADGVLSADATRNMKNVKEAYRRWGLTYNFTPGTNGILSSETPNGTISINSLKPLEVTAEYATMIESGAKLTSIVASASTGIPGFATVKKVLGPVAGTIKDTGTQMADVVSTYNRNIYTRVPTP